MAGSHFTVELDSDAAGRQLARVIEQINDPTPLFADIGEALLLSHDLRWGEDADGTPWEPLKPATVKRKAQLGRANAGILVLDEHLRRLVTRHDRNSVEIGTPEVYGATHQFGADDRGIPARPFLGLSDGDIDEIGDLVTDYLEDALRG